MVTTWVSLVFGFVADADEIPAEAAAAGLRRRFAVSMISDATGSAEPFFDRDVLEALFMALLPLWPAGRVVASKPGSSARVFASAIAAIEGGALSQDPADLCGDLTLFAQERPVCMVRTLPYHAVGGPAPYHDAFVFEFFVSSYDATELEALLEGISCRRVFELEIVRALPEPRWSRWARLRRLLSR